jgi:hypothetical protein
MNACDGEVLIDDIHKDLRDLAVQIAANSIPTEKFVISKVKVVFLGKFTYLLCSRI